MRDDVDACSYSFLQTPSAEKSLLFVPFCHSRKVFNIVGGGNFDTYISNVLPVVCADLSSSRASVNLEKNIYVYFDCCSTGKKKEKIGLYGSFVASFPSLKRSSQEESNILRTRE